MCTDAHSITLSLVENYNPLYSWLQCVVFIKNGQLGRITEKTVSATT